MKLNDSEWLVMNAVWKRPPATVRQVVEDLGNEAGWAYTTVKTMLERLVEKGALRAEKRGRVAVFTPLVSRREARRSALRLLIEKAFDGAFGSLFQHIVAEEKLSKRDRERLAAMLEELRRPPEVPRR
jgi:predicted transcriptional regulator